MQIIDDIRIKKEIIKKQTPVYFSDGDFIPLPSDDETSSASFYVSFIGDRARYFYINKIFKSIGLIKYPYLFHSNEDKKHTTAPQLCARC